MAKKRASGPSISTPEIVDVSSLREHPDNPRIGDVDAIAESVSAAGLFWSALVVDVSGQVLAGNHRLRAARKLGIERVPVVRVDVDEATAKRILVADNRLGETGDYDDAKLLAILSATGTAGTGFDDEDSHAVAALLAADESGAAHSLPEWDDTPIEARAIVSLIGPLEWMPRIRELVAREFPGGEVAVRLERS